MEESAVISSIALWTNIVVAATGQTSRTVYMRVNGLKTIGLVVLFCAAATNALAFYNPQAGRWLTRDPLEEDGGLNVYCFVSNDSISKLDPLGLSLDYTTVKHPEPGDCGSYDPGWNITWRLTKRAKTGGLVIQHIVRTLDVTDCKNHSDKDYPRTIKYWEIVGAIPMNDTVTHQPWDDQWNSMFSADGKKGSDVIQGTAI